MLSIVCVFLLVIFQTSLAFSSNELFSETHTATAALELAHSDPLYNNVGVLYIDSILPARATVTYIGGRTCLTAAHCFQGSVMRDHSFFWNLFLSLMYQCNAWFKPQLRVAFEVNDEIKHYSVRNYSVHPAYAAKESHVDLAIIQLDRVPDRDADGLTGLPLCYDFGTKVENFERVYEDITIKNRGEHIPNQLTYVGYGGCCTASLGQLENMYNMRTACRSVLMCVTRATGMYTLVSAGRGINLHSLGKDMYESKRRPLLPFETGVLGGMSGGPTLCEGSVVGINAASTSDCVALDDQKEMNLRWYKNFCIQLVNFFIPPLWLHPISTYPVDEVLFGTMNISIPLGPHKEWIEDTKREFDKGLVIADQV
jgi:hypothetical protein